MGSFPVLPAIRGHGAYLERPETRIFSKLLEILRVELRMRFPLSTRAIGPLIIVCLAIAADSCFAELGPNLPLWRVAEAD